jgi:hypothetical protein
LNEYIDGLPLIDVYFIGTPNCPYTVDDLMKHRIKIVSEEKVRKRFCLSRVQLVEVHHEGEFAIYKVDIDRFQIIFNLLNIQRKSVIGSDAA